MFLEDYGEITAPPPLASLRIAFRYNPGLRYCWVEVKRGGYFGIAKYLGELLAAQLAKDDKYLDLFCRKPLFIPVPLSTARHRERGFNQVESMLKGLQKFLGESYGLYPEMVASLVRNRNTESQVGKNFFQRQQNLKAAFTFRGNVEPERPVVIVDDIYTSGTTINECAAVLKRAGFKEIHGLVFARG